MMAIRVLDVDDWKIWRELRLRALAEAPHAFSTQLADWQGEGDTDQRWRDRLTTVPFNAVAELDGVPAGMVSGTFPDENGTVELISMWVAPHARGRGAGDLLVRAVIEWAKENGSGQVVLGVVDTNLHAANLYRRHGFVDADSVAEAPNERRMIRS